LETDALSCSCYRLPDQLIGLEEEGWRKLIGPPGSALVKIFVTYLAR
jgi:hypothetical protein